MSRMIFTIVGMDHIFQIISKRELLTPQHSLVMNGFFLAKSHHCLVPIIAFVPSILDNVRFYAGLFPYIL